MANLFEFLRVFFQLEDRVQSELRRKGPKRKRILVLVGNNSRSPVMRRTLLEVGGYNLLATALTVIIAPKNICHD